MTFKDFRENAYFKIRKALVFMLVISGISLYSTSTAQFAHADEVVSPIAIGTQSGTDLFIEFDRMLSFDIFDGTNFHISKDGTDLSLVVSDANSSTEASDGRMFIKLQTDAPADAFLSGDISVIYTPTLGTDQLKDYDTGLPLNTFTESFNVNTSINTIKDYASDGLTPATNESPFADIHRQLWAAGGAITATTQNSDRYNYALGQTPSNSFNRPSDIQFFISYINLFPSSVLKSDSFSTVGSWSFDPQASTFSGTVPYDLGSNDEPYVLRIHPDLTNAASTYVFRDSGSYVSVNTPSSKSFDVPSYLIGQGMNMPYFLDVVSSDGNETDTFQVNIFRTPQLIPNIANHKSDVSMLYSNSLTISPALSGLLDDETATYQWGIIEGAGFWHDLLTGGEWLTAPPLETSTVVITPGDLWSGYNYGGVTGGIFHTILRLKVTAHRGEATRDAESSVTLHAFDTVPVVTFEEFNPEISGYMGDSETITPNIILPNDGNGFYFDYLNYTYQWEESSTATNNDWASLQGATDAELTFQDLSEAQNGAQYRLVVTTALDDGETASTTSDPYTLTVMAPSSNADLTSWSIGGIEPVYGDTVFETATAEYSFTRPYQNNQIDFSVHKDGRYQSIQIWSSANNDTRTVTSNENSQLDLPVGASTFYVQVTAQDATTVKTYTVNFNRTCYDFDHLGNGIGSNAAHCGGDVIIGNEITAIGWFGDQDPSYSPITSVVLPENLAIWNHYPFEYQYQLASFSISDQNPNFAVEDGVLYNKDKTTLYAYPAGKTDAIFEVPSTVTRIDDGAFSSAQFLHTLILSENLKTISSWAFEFSSLETITIPSSISYIGDAIFWASNSLASILLSGGNDTYTVINNVLYSDAGETLMAYPAGIKRTTFTVPDAVTKIGYGAFVNGLTHLSSLTIPDTVSSIGDYVFYYDNWPHDLWNAPSPKKRSITLNINDTLAGYLHDGASYIDNSITCVKSDSTISVGARDLLNLHSCSTDSSIANLFASTDSSEIAISGASPYTATVAHSVNHVFLNAFASDSNASISVGNGLETTTATSGETTTVSSLHDGANTIFVVVTSEDESTSTTYSLVITRDVAAVVDSGPSEQQLRDIARAREARIAAARQIALEKAAADKAAAADAARAAADKAAAADAARAAADKAAADKAAADKAAADKAAADKAAADKAAADKAESTRKAAGALPIVENAYVAPPAAGAPAPKVVSATANSITTSITVDKPLELKLPSVAKGAPITVTLKLPDGTTIKVAKTTAKKSGAFTVPALQFAAPGTYVMTVKVGGKTKTIKIVVKG